MKRTKVIITSVIVFISLIGITTYLSFDRKNTQKIIQDYTLENIKSQNIPITANEMKTYLKDKYLEVNDIAAFYSDQNFGKTISLGELTGALRLLNGSSFNESQKNDLKRIFYDYLKTKPNLSELDLLYFESFLYKGGINTKINAKEAENIVMKYYNKTNNLFEKEANEPLNLLLDDTSLVIEVSKNYGFKLSVSDEVKSRILEMYNSQDYFRLDNTDYVMSQAPFSILKILNQFNLNSDKIKTADFHKKWINWQQTNLKKHYEKSSLGFAYLNYLLEANVFFNQIPKETIDFIIASSKSDSSEFENFDLDGMYQLLDLCKKSKVSINNQLTEIINKKIDEQASRGYILKQQVQYNIDDVYYGVILSDKFNISYNESKIKNGIIKYIEQNIDENFKYEDYQDVRNVFYTVLLSKKMGLNLNISDTHVQKMNLFILQKIEELNNGNNKPQGFSYGNLYEVYMTTQTLRLLNKKVDIHAKNNIKQLMSNKSLEDLDNGFSNTIIAYYELYNRFVGKNNIEDNVVQYLNKHYWNGQGYKRVKDSTLIDLQSTYNVIKRFKNNKALNTIDKNLIVGFRDKKNLYNVSNLSDYSRMEIVFYGIKLEELIK